MNTENFALFFVILLLTLTVGLTLFFTIDTNIKVNQIANDYAGVKCETE